MSERDLYRFGDFTLDASRGVLLRDGALVTLPPKALDVLVVLVASAGDVVPKEELMRRVWPDTFVEEGNLAVNIFTLRKVLGGSSEGFIRTVPKRGYCFVAPVERPAPKASRRAESASPAAPPAPIPAPAVTPPRRTPMRLVLLGALLAAAATLTLSVISTTREGHLALSGSVATIAVLPFSVSGMDGPEEYLGPGFASAVADVLSKRDRLIVRPMTSTAKYGGGVPGPIEAGRALRVDHVLHGVLRRTGEQLAITVSLVRVSDGTVTWTLSSTEPVDQLPGFERRITAGVAETLGAADAAGDPRMAEPRTRNSAAYLSYLRGRHAGLYVAPRDLERAVAALATAAESDPEFADALSALAVAQTLPANTQATTDKYEQGVAAARRALALDGHLSGPHTVLGRSAVVTRWDWTEAEREYKQAVAIAPYDAEPHFWYALHLCATGRFDEALSEMRFSLQVDPTSPRINLYTGILLFMAHRYEEAAAQLRTTPIEMGAIHQQVYMATAMAEMKRGRLDEAFATLDRAAGAGRSVPTAQWTAHRALLLVAAGRNAEALPLLAGLEQPTSARMPLTIVGAAYACAGRMEAAFEYLGQAVDQRDSRIIFANVDPLLDCARRDARFARLLERLRLGPRTSGARSQSQ